MWCVGVRPVCVRHVRVRPMRMMRMVAMWAVAVRGVRVVWMVRVMGVMTMWRMAMWRMGMRRMGMRTMRMVRMMWVVPMAISVAVSIPSVPVFVCGHGGRRWSLLLREGLLPLGIRHRKHPPAGVSKRLMGMVRVVPMPIPVAVAIAIATFVTIDTVVHHELGKRRMRRRQHKGK